MIIGFRHKGLKLLYQLALPGFRLHQLKGTRSGYWAIDVSRNWRVVFRFDGIHATDVDLVDYH